MFWPEADLDNFSISGISLKESGGKSCLGFTRYWHDDRCDAVVDTLLKMFPIGCLLLQRPQERDGEGEELDGQSL